MCLLLSAYFIPDLITYTDEDIDHYEYYAHCFIPPLI
nr:MAG TPA: hypothetical protein [Caudoviricetes sp.]